MIACPARFLSRLRYTVWRRDAQCRGLFWFLSAHGTLWEAEYAAQTEERKGRECDIYDEWEEANERAS